MAKYALEDYARLCAEGKERELKPEDFGCKDWWHLPDGKMDDWTYSYSVTPDPNKEWKPDPNGIPFEKQQYNGPWESSGENMTGAEKRIKECEILDLWDQMREWE